MAKYRFYGSYNANLTGLTITFSSALRKALEGYGLKDLYFVKTEESGFRSIQAYTRRYPGKSATHVKVGKGKFIIPRRSKRKELAQYAGLRRNKTKIIGSSSNYFEIWNEDELEKFLA